MNPEHSIEIGGRAYPLLWSTNAAYQLELHLKQNKMGTLVDFMSQLGTPGSVLNLTLLFWAQLEGARRKTNGRYQPYTIDEAGDLIDKAGGLGADGLVVEKLSAVMEAFYAAIPKPEESGEATTKNEPARSGHGKRSSRRASSVDSPLMNSGTAHSAKSNS